MLTCFKTRETKVKTWLDILIFKREKMTFRNWENQEHGIIKQKRHTFPVRAMKFAEVVANSIHPDRQKINRSHSSMVSCVVI